MGHSEQLRRKLTLVLPSLASAQREFLQHPRLAALYPEYVFMMHCRIRASVPLMQAAAQRCRELAATGEDPVAAALVPYLEEHIVEEMHDHWPLEDLEVLGHDRTEVLARLPAPTIAALVGAQYYWIHHAHPIALLGYMELAEGYPATGELVETMIAATGLPRAAFRSIARHAEADIEHNRERHLLLDSLPLRPEHIALMAVSALTTAHAESQTFLDLVARA